jgi:hypothetical protein
MEIGRGRQATILDLISELDESAPSSSSACLIEHPRSIGERRLVTRIQHENHPPYLLSKGGRHQVTEEVEDLGGKQAREMY